MVYTPRTTARAHQLRALAALEKRPPGKDAFAWLCGMGTGKTWIHLAEFGILEEAKEITDLLVIAPAGCYRNWYIDRPEEPSELTKHLNPALRERIAIGAWESGSAASKRSIERLLKTQGRPRALFVNVEALSTVKAARDAVRAFLEGGRALMGIDESTTIRGYNSARTKAIIALGQHARARRIMSGLPTPRSPLDLYSQFEFLDWRILGHRSYYSFRARYAQLVTRYISNRSFIEIAKDPAGNEIYLNQEELRERIAPWSFRVVKEECLDIPPKVYMRREIDLTAEQKKICKELKEDAISVLSNGSYVSATQILTQLIRIHQAMCGYVVTEDNKPTKISSNRLSELLYILSEHNGKAIIWCGYDYSIREVSDAIEKEYGKGSVARYWGANRDTRGDDEARFKRDPNCRFMVSTPSAGGRGNTWIVADLVIFYSNGWDLEHREQAEDRAHRDGQTKSVTYIDMLVPDSIEERQIKQLRSRKHIAATITGDSWKEWFR